MSEPKGSGVAGGSGTAAVPTGNAFDKYGSSHPVVRRLMGRFVRTLDELVAVAAPASVLDVGCGEGVLTRRLAARPAAADPGVAGHGRAVVGVDLPDPGLRAHWEAAVGSPAPRPGEPGALFEPGPRNAPGGGSTPAGGLRFEAMPAEQLRFDDGAFELVCALEVLEHVADPDAVLAEMTRVAARWVLVSVPREPLWRALNLARGAYVAQLGNTPGHVGHFGARSIVDTVSRHAEVVAVRAPLPWTMLLARVG